MRRVGLPDAFRGVIPGAYYPSSWGVPEVFTARGRWVSGPLHTFTDDWRQETFWRRPQEGLLVACCAGVVTAPDFTVYEDDPVEWRRYQAWRSAVVAGYWSAAGLDVLPVVSFGGGAERYVLPGSTWAVRGPGRGADEGRWLDSLWEFVGRSVMGRLVLFGRCPPGVDDLGVEVVRRRLLDARGKGGQDGGSCEVGAGSDTGARGMDHRSQRKAADAIRAHANDGGRGQAA